MGWRVRPARVEDGPRVSQVRVLSWQHSYRHILPEPALAAMRPEAGADQWSAHAVAEPPTKLFVAVDDDDVPVAFCLVGAARDAVDRHRDLATGELWAIYADPAVLGTGAGSAVHDVALEYLACQGFRYAVLWVFEANEGAMRFYRKHGWAPDGGREGFEWGGGQATEVRYARPLALDQSSV